MPAFTSVDDVAARFLARGYVCDRRIATALYLADHMEKPILVEGPAGVGKTELAKTLAEAIGSDLIRLQCYEGLDEAKALYEWEYPKQLLYTQILRDKIGDVVAGTKTLAEAVERLAAQEDAFFSERFLLSRPLLAAIRSPSRAVLLIDEVDRAEPEFEAFLLEVLSDYQVSVPELGTIRARHIPMVILTSNNARDMTDALKRRCLHLHIGFPDAARELEIVRLRLPGLSERLAAAVVAVVQEVRKLDLKKLPSVSETLDWARALVVLNAAELDEGLARDTLNLILKYEGDVERAAEKLPEIFSSLRTRAQS
ncbi:MAG: MoxR family ATPase [Myxococcales bacterium]|nr:MoxR family ATPase [Myxococcales bacterium]